MDIIHALDDCLAVFSEECKIYGQSDALGKIKISIILFICSLLIADNFDVCDFACLFVKVP